MKKTLDDIICELRSEITAGENTIMNAKFVPDRAFPTAYMRQESDFRTFLDHLKVQVRVKKALVQELVEVEEID